MAIADSSEGGAGMERLIGLPLGADSSIGDAGGFLTNSQIEDQIKKIASLLDIDDKNLLLILPDSTRSCPLPELLPILHEEIGARANSITALIALGTHAPMKDEEIDKFFAGDGSVKNKYPNFNFVNHEWWKEETFETIGTIPASKMRALSFGNMDKDVEVKVNKLVTESDLVLILGPVFPHEVVGFSGGAKYLFPGVSGKEMIDNSHWLGALISSVEIIGKAGITPVREMINTAASFIKTPLYVICLVVTSGAGKLHAISFGKPHSAWELASAISAKTHIEYLQKPVKRVFSVIPSKYTDIWVAAKGMYKVEPIIEDGGEVIIYAPHVTEFAYSHPELEEIGYHCRAYFTEQWEDFKHFHWGVLAHSTHLRGAGTYSKESGEKCRITVTLATGISKERVEAMNLKYLDPNSINPRDFETDSNTLFIPNAGEILFRLN